MARRCELCGKKPSRGNSVTTRGMAKAKGGVGKKTTGITRRRFLPNIQKVKVIINGNDYQMKKVGGDALTGEIYSIEMTLGARNHTYYFEIDDDEGHIVVSEVFRISVSAAEVAEKEEADLLPLPISQCWVILILLVIVIVVLIYLFVVKV